MSALRIVLVDTPAKLARTCAHCETCPVIGLDTEFERRRTYYPRAGLLQVSDGESSFLIVPEAVGDLGPYFDLLTNKQALKVIHACGEDLVVFDRLGGVLPRPLFDTQIGAACAGHRMGIGYAELVHALLGVTLPKDATRSNWLKRPLTQRQLDYAGRDVAHLRRIHTTLARTLGDLGRAHWVAEDVEDLLAPERFRQDPETAYLRLGDAWRLDRRALAVLRGLCAWRERQAEGRDLARGFVLRDTALLHMARQPPCDLDDLSFVPDLYPRAVRGDGTQLLAVVQEAMALPETRLPAPMAPPLDLRGQADNMARLKRAIRARAAALDVAPELLASTKALRALVAHVKIDSQRSLPKPLCGWRRPVVGEHLLALLDQDA